MCPLVRELEGRAGVEVSVCVTGQHREMLHEVLEQFDVKPSIDLNLMREGQSLPELTAALLRGLDGALCSLAPDRVLLHGDTATTFAGALACYYLKIPFDHIEAGLRTGDIRSPFPEEFNRRAATLVASRHFAPTQSAKENLLAEGVRAESIFVTGNTGIDTLRYTVRDDYELPRGLVRQGKMIILTAHRRESLGAPMENIFSAVRRLVAAHPDIYVICPCHPNPAVGCAARRAFEGVERVVLCPPLGVADFHNLLSRAYFIMSDSGGLQEEAPALGKPLLVLRETTERPEGIRAGGLMAVGTDGERIFEAASRLIEDETLYRQMSSAQNPFGDGYASRRIADIIVRDV